jgi:hypothetical protein
MTSAVKTNVKPAEKTAEKTAPAVNLAALSFTEAPDIKITRKRKARELSPFAAKLTESKSSGKTFQVTAPDESTAKQYVTLIRGDAKQLDIGHRVHVDAPSAANGNKWTVRFMGRNKRGYNTVVTS